MLFDRLFGSYTPTERAGTVRYGLDGFDSAPEQPAAGLLKLLWRSVSAGEVNAGYGRL